MRPFVLAIAVLLGSTTPVLADTFQNFNVQGTVRSGGTAVLSGTVALDETTGVFTNSMLTVSGNGESQIESGPPDDYGFVGIGTRVDFGSGTPADYLDIDLYIPGRTLIGYSGGNVCTLFDLCGDVEFSSFVNGSLFFGVIYGATLTPTNTTPEPSSLFLLGTGLAALIAHGRKRSV